MSLRSRFEDTIAIRFVLSILLALFVGASLTWVVLKISGVSALPPLETTGLVPQARDIIRMIEAAPSSERSRLADVAGRDNPFKVSWRSAESTTSVLINAKGHVDVPDDNGIYLGAPGRRIIQFNSRDLEPYAAGAVDFEADLPDAQNFAVSLTDGSWVIFIIPKMLWGLGSPARVGIGLILLTLSILFVSTIAAIHLARPIREFTEALRRFGADPKASPLPETGPRELRMTITAFNAMQRQVQRFVDDRTLMLAAISHDLRTPLTKMRLRGDFIEDSTQRSRLFRDVDDMQAMIDAALSFFRDELADEETTGFDLPQLIQTILDDFNDRGIVVPYAGPDHVTSFGRPFALKRAFNNIIDNAVKYGEHATVELRALPDQFVIFIRDKGPGIPANEAENVFSPFVRLERSRNRSTGGVGLGLTSARSIVRAHGGDIVMRRISSIGFEVEVVLPR